MRVATALCSALVSGCALLQPDGGETLQVREIVGAAASGARASAEEQGRQLAHAQQMYAAVPDDANRLRLAALLSTLPLPWRDDARVVTLLEPLASRRQGSPLTQLASLMVASAADRQRLARELRAAERREGAAEERAVLLRQQLQAAEERAALLRQQLQAAEERAGTLRQQLDALKSIERGILEREERRRKINR